MHRKYSNNLTRRLLTTKEYHCKFTLLRFFNMSIPLIHFWSTVDAVLSSRPQ